MVAHSISEVEFKKLGGKHTSKIKYIVKIIRPIYSCRNSEIGHRLRDECN